MPRLVLASTSSARRALFERVGLEFEAISPGIDEPMPSGVAPSSLASGLALAKARAVSVRRPEAVVVGADQVLAFEGRCWSKAPDVETARRELRELSGRTHELVSAVAIVAPGRPDDVFVEVARMTMRALSPEQQERYLATDEWIGCAGGYRVEGRGLALFERIDGEHSTILGLPMPSLLVRLAALGIEPW